MVNLRWKIEKLNDAYDNITILEMPKEWLGRGRLGDFAGIEVWSTYPFWDGRLFLPGNTRKRDPIKVHHADTPRVHAALEALEHWHRTGEKPVETVEYGEFPKEVGE